MMDKIEEFLKINKVKDRFELWYNFLLLNKLKTVAELGVYKGEFAKVLLDKCSSIEKYYMVDPWRKLDDWNKPANTSSAEFENIFKEALNKTYFAKSKRTILKGKTIEVINEIEDESLDFIYIDGDHTLRGISIDLLTSWNKVSENGFVAGDDFCPSIWQHSTKFEPTLIFPFALYFAESVDRKIYALPFNQFLISKENKGFEFVNLSGQDYSRKTLLQQFKGFKEQKENDLVSRLFKRF
tara:strand:+ start:360 stop:1079 length:720 start_codon:yes stop_codon:yes gene_type:complete